MAEGTSKHSTAYVLLACWMGWLVTAAGRQVSDIVKDEMAVGLGIGDLLNISLTIDVSFWIGYIITALLLGILSDRIGRKKIIYISLFLFSIPTGLIAIAPEQLFIYVRFLQGLSVGGFFPVAVALLGDLYPVEGRSKAVGRFVSGGIFGAIVGWFVAGIADDLLGAWQWGFLLMVPPIIIIAVLSYFFIEESTKFETIRNEAKSSSVISSIKSLLNNRFLLIALLFCALDLFTLWVVDDWLPFMVKDLYSISSTEAALFRAISAFSGILGILFFGFYADKFGRKKALITAVIGGISATIGLFVVSLTLPFSFMYPLSAAVGFFALGEFAAIYVLVMENAPDHRYGMAMGICISIGNAIALTGGPISASLAQGTVLGLYAFLVVPLIALAIRLPLSLIAKDPAFVGIGEKLE